MAQEYLPSRNFGFEDRRQAVINTADAHDLSSEHIILQSGAAFALHGLDTRVDELATEAFDVDAVFDIQDQDAAHKYSVLFQHYLSGTVPPSQSASPQVPIGPLATPRVNWPLVFSVNYEIPVTTIEGIQTPDVATLVRSKAAAGRPKDNIGLLQAYLLDQTTNRTHSDNPVWHEVMPQILTTIEKSSVSHSKQGVLTWVSKLVEQQFQVPELANISS